MFFESALTRDDESPPPAYVSLEVTLYYHPHVLSFKLQSKPLLLFESFSREFSLDDEVLSSTLSVRLTP